MTPEMRAEWHVLEADLIADFVAMTSEVESTERTERHLGHRAEACALVLVVILGFACLIAGVATLPADLVMIVPNGLILTYRHMRDI
jgi:hypothetical protein